MDVKNLNELHRIILTCSNCNLHTTRTNAVPGTGSAKAELMFIGEAPGAREDLEGKPFIGAAGKILAELLDLIHLSRQQVFITNVVKCRPPNNRNPSDFEISTCSEYLFAQIKYVNPKLIVPLGRFATNYFLPKEPITKVAGILHAVGDYKVYPLLHPAASLRRKEYKVRLETDFKKLPMILRNAE
ncbi:MAG TPA: uracil-DNA glycosylase [Dehalococcoidia bacterium]|jgi:uracil-DNA glycosylase|nr:uracil-DNA glycosylase [Dehalococcoidia bacterium]|tara:strand:+ start:916 stop:1473 length:558 start_codon:yes stop_codon:yes gene_type:complete